MSQPLDYARPTRKKGNSFAIAAGVSVSMQSLIVTAASASLDNARGARAAMIVAAAFWVVLFATVWRRRRDPSRGDLFFIVLGYPIMLLLSTYFGTDGLPWIDPYR